ncbi:phosphate ABC transporter permease PstA [uncultured Traorella sp.]|uniref:phosphate ABC transporter permease PstA n=1 Tax=uncultured Traorella sp. TaxID=1929048 RepID=UPI0025DD5D07|nr:phosphate ABC transporter permease PstA [uncultured Traorella sp.]
MVKKISEHQQDANDLRIIHKDKLSVVLNVLVKISAFITMAVLIIMIAYILITGIPNITLDQFSLEYNTENVSMMPAIINTLLYTVLSLLIALPLGIGSAIYLVEYAKKGSKFVEIVRLTTETLSGIPSIIFGLFGYLFLCIFCGLGYSLLSGVITLSIIILPLIMRTTEEALKAVPDSYREGSYGLGAGKVRTIFKIILPSAVGGILNGIILSIGRIVGESAALIYTAGTLPNIALNVMKSGRSLSVHMYALLSEGLYTNQAYATAVVLLLMVMLINFASNKIVKHMGGKNEQN